MKVSKWYKRSIALGPQQIGGKYISSLFKCSDDNRAEYLMGLKNRGVGRNFSRGGRFKCYFLKVFFCTDLCPNTFYRKCNV